MNRRAGALPMIVGCLLAWGAAAYAQCGGTQLCGPGTGDCVIAADCTINLPAAGLVIDLGARRLVIRRNLRILGPAGAQLAVFAGALDTDGGSLVAPGAQGTAGGVRIIAAGDITVRNGTLFDVSAGTAAGVVELTSFDGAVSFNGRVRANVGTRQGSGGEIVLAGARGLTIDATLFDASGGDLGFGGAITLESSSGPISVNAPLNVRGGSGGIVGLDAGTTIEMASTASIGVSANGDASPGGTIDIEADGDVVIRAPITGNGSRPDLRQDRGNGGDGGELSVDSFNGAVSILGPVELIGAPGASGGTVELVAAGSVTIGNRLVASSSGVFGSGGVIYVGSGRAVSIAGRMDVGGDSGSGGQIQVEAADDLTVSAPLVADGDANGGWVMLAGCRVTVAPTGSLSARGPGVDPAGTNQIIAGGPFAIQGPLRATLRNLLEFRSTPPVIAPGVVVSPGAIQRRDLSIPCCIACSETTTTTSTTTTTAPGGEARCGDGIVNGVEQCDDGNTLPGDCCSPSCRFESAGAPCADDGNACTRDVCDGLGRCDHPAGNAGAVCRPAAGLCDEAEVCTGTSPSCPADRKRTAVCRQAVGPCDQAEQCDGIGDTCPPDRLLPRGTPCRPAAGDCDLPELCTGNNAACPADAKRIDVCRPSLGTCDPAERCDGVRDLCPPDVRVPDGTPCVGIGCSDTGGVCRGGVCDGVAPDPCGPCEVCDPGPRVCRPLLRSGCLSPVVERGGQVQIRKSLRGPGSDLVAWKWDAGPALTPGDFGNPLSPDERLALCVFDPSGSTPRLLFRAVVPTGAACGPDACWEEYRGSGYRFTSRDGTGADGVRRVLLRGGPAGRSRIRFLARGWGLSERPFAVPRPPLPVPLVVQLHGGGERCWESWFSRPGILRHDSQEFRARSE